MRNGAWELVKAPLGGGAVARLGDAIPGGAATDWSPTGEWVAHPRLDGLHLVSPDGATTRVLTGLHSGAFRFSRDGTRLFAVSRNSNRAWTLTTWNVATAREVHSVGLPLASSADVQGLTLAPDDSHIIVGAGADTSDIWLLEQFEPRSGRPSWLRW